MAEYYVEVPIAGRIGLCVTASSEDEAVNMAMEGAAHYMLKLEDPLPENLMEGDLEWDCYERLTSGNVNHFPFNELLIEKEEV